MAKKVLYDGVEHSFPDDATDDEVRAALEALDAPPGPRFQSKGQQYRVAAGAPPAPPLPFGLDKTKGVPDVGSHLANEGAGQSFLNVVKSPFAAIGQIASRLTEGPQAYQRRKQAEQDAAEHFAATATPDQKRQAGKNAVLGLPFVSTAYKASQGNIPGVMGDLGGVAALGGMEAGIMAGPKVWRKAVTETPTYQSRRLENWLRDNGAPLPEAVTAPPNKAALPTSLQFSGVTPGGAAVAAPSVPGAATMDAVIGHLTDIAKTTGKGIGEAVGAARPIYATTPNQGTPAAPPPTGATPATPPDPERDKLVEALKASYQKIVGDPRATPQQKARAQEALDKYGPPAGPVEPPQAPPAKAKAAPPSDPVDAYIQRGRLGRKPYEQIYKEMPDDVRAEFHRRLDVARDLPEADFQAFYKKVFRGHKGDAELLPEVKAAYEDGIKRLQERLGTDRDGAERMARQFADLHASMTGGKSSRSVPESQAFGASFRTTVEDLEKHTGHARAAERAQGAERKPVWQQAEAPRAQAPTTTAPVTEEQLIAAFGPERVARVKAGAANRPQPGDLGAGKRAQQEAAKQLIDTLLGQYDHKTRTFNTKANGALAKLNVEKPGLADVATGGKGGQLKAGFDRLDKTWTRVDDPGGSGFRLGVPFLDKLRVYMNALQPLKARRQRTLDPTSKEAALARQLADRGNPAMDDGAAMRTVRALLLGLGTQPEGRR